MEAKLTLDDLELARGRREMARQVSDIAKAKPGARIRKSWPNVPLCFMDVPGAPEGLPLLVDPLGILERAGIEVSCTEMATETDENSDWMRI